MYDPFPSPSSDKMENMDLYLRIYFQYSNGKKFFDEKQYQKAVTEYEGLLQLDIQNHMSSLIEPFLMEYAYSLYMVGQVDTSLLVIDKLLELYPRKAEYWRCKGDILNNAGRYNDAIRAYDNALRMNPKDGYALRGKGNSLRFLKRYDEALILLKEGYYL